MIVSSVSFSLLDGYALIENFFLMPAASVMGQLVEEKDKEKVCLH